MIWAVSSILAKHYKKKVNTTVWLGGRGGISRLPHLKQISFVYDNKMLIVTSFFPILVTNNPHGSNPVCFITEEQINSQGAPHQTISCYSLQEENSKHWMKLRESFTQWQELISFFFNPPKPTRFSLLLNQDRILYASTAIRLPYPIRLRV